MSISLLAPWLLLLSLLFCGVSLAGTTVEKWQPMDLTFKTTITWKFSLTDPFAVAFDAEVTGPDNVTFTQSGFYDGEDTWKIRFAPNREGEWIITTLRCAGIKPPAGSRDVRDQAERKISWRLTG
jgi:Domain of unknown function (DUF5060)